MTEPSPQRPVPGPPLPGPPLPGPPPSGPPEQAAATETAPGTDSATFDDLDRRPVAEHVAIFEAEHARLRDELSTIDQL